MKGLMLSLALFFLSSTCLYSQNRDVKPNRDEIQSQKLVLIEGLRPE